MKIYHSIDQFTPVKNPVVTSGTFDGVHLGHQKILEQIRRIADREKGETVLITFWPHPRHVLNDQKFTLKLLSTFEEKARLLENSGIDHLVRIEFTQEFSQLTSMEFIQQILIDKIRTHRLVIGYDHRFGKNREGSFEHLKANADRFGFKVEEIDKQEVDHIGVSSTRIRESLINGEVDTAANLLGRAYSLHGVVESGKNLGHKLGYPTANIRIAQPYKLIPADGTYAVHTVHGKKRYQGMLNIGFRPTIGGTERTIEVHIFDFNQDIYGE
jgi:riboflavin kinase/FMN adenylyltransferase